MLAVGEHILGHIDDRTLMLTTGFAGGVGDTRQDVCGALCSGIMLIGALHGRTQADVDDKRCQLLAARYRERFLQAFGSTNCGELRQRHSSCSVLVEQVAHILMDVIEIRPVVTPELTIDEALSAYVEGRLEDHPEKLH